MAGVCWFSKLPTISVDEEKKSPLKQGKDSFGKWSWLTGPSIHGAKKKSRRCFPKESSLLGKRIVDAKRKQSIYSQKSLNCYASGGSNTGLKHSKIIVFPLGFREVFSLLPFCLCGFILSNTMELGGFGKDTWIADKIHYLFEDSCELMSHPWQGKGWTEHADIPQLPPCMDRVIPYNPHSFFLLSCYWLKQAL